MSRAASGRGSLGVEASVSLPGRVAAALFCAACRATIRAPEPPLCARCGESLHNPHAQRPALPGTEEWLCEVCAAGRGPTTLTALRAAAAYDGAVRQAVLALKYRRQPRAAAPLGALLADALRALGWQPDLIMPVPLHRDRVQRRGYNQAELLARRCARLHRFPFRTDLLIRRRATRPQVGLSAADRHSNVADAFTLASPRAAALLDGKRILLIDDVATTGSTLDASAAALLPAHPAIIWGLAVTRPELAADNADAHASVAYHGPSTASGRHAP
jgi:ComF family protein